MTSSGTGGYIATYRQIFEPVKPVTTPAPSLRARIAVFLTCSAARARTLGVAVAPGARAGDVLVAEIQRVVADELALCVVGERPDAQAVPVEDLLAAAQVLLVLQRPVDVEVLRLAGDLQAVEAPAGRELAHLLEREVGPLCGEKRYRVLHDCSTGVACTRAIASPRIRGDRPPGW
ncbi:hypothetical protein ACFQ1L_13645 [Phytohabitans flavus]|uniref:hypothetical protein n=1 Tax=Phytohabitans flavus TaxID=1076124 RepID=UPI00363649D3